MRPYISLLLCVLLFSCAPVLQKELMDSAVQDVSFNAVFADPDAYMNKLFILGGIIVDTKATAEGSLIEAIHVEVDDRGYLEDILPTTKRYLALLPKGSGFLDPLIYKKKRTFTIAATLIGTRDGKIDDMDYRFPLFRIEEIHLWPRETVHPPPYPYWYGDPYFYYPYWWRDPYWRRGRYDPWYPYPYW